MTSDLSKVDLLCQKNNEGHRTSEISTERLIVRRGQTFLLTLHSSSARSLKSESLELTVQTGPEPSEDLGTKCVFGVAGESLAKKSWDAKVQETSATSVTLAITSPADASIGEYTLSVKTNPDMTVGHSAGAFVLLFNPWCAEDWVHLADEEERQEYVMSEHGLIYRGTSDYIHELAWDFGQFESDILDICLKMLDLNPKCKKNAAEDFSARCNPIYVSRVVSAMINSNDDRGVLQGNWSIFFWGGVSPMHWNGSLDILRKWKESDYHPVKYGQCWVFGGVMCTGVHCCGPAAVKAVHEGHTELKYDLPFVFAEVNADRVNWKIMADGSQKRILLDTKLVGQNISTKSVGSDERLDITANYKYPEGTEKEREAFKEAVKRSEKLREPEPAPVPPPPKISVKIEEHSKLINGTDIDLVIRLQSPTPRDVVLHVNAQVMLYNSVLESDVCSEEQEVQLLTNEELTVPFQIPFSKYGSHIQENKSIKVTAVANDKEHTEEVYLAEKDIVLENPPFSITVIGNPVQLKNLQAEINFDNPLPEALTNCSIKVSGSGLLRDPVETRFLSVGPGQQARVIVAFTPYRIGPKKLMANLNCDQFRDIQTSCKIHVKSMITGLF
ncbi:protein-glutamine gamma-glutamyltransferase 2-like isoform X4 [Anguilla rostrata]|uniref:protein-glutamine gamma-glutamyltransferase 2-like isoform X4 n=1 Tax=Anguilla rostrata TaxID=7938 RepID=UPI0030D32E75